jgi:hypothetical protein
MQINLKKTKIMVLQKSNKKQTNTQIQHRRHNTTIYPRIYLSRIKTYTYREIYFTDTKELTEKVLHGMFAVRKKVNFHNIKPKLAIKIFDSIISPILLHNSEVWGAFTTTDLNKWDKTPTEKVHIRFCKMYLCVHKKATNIACRGELGKFPLIISIRKRIIKYVAHLKSLPNSAIAKQAFLISKDHYRNNKPSLHTNLMKILKLYDSSAELNALDNISPPQISLYIQNAKDKYT